MASVAKAVIPAAGRGTRSLPASKVVPKELLPVIDKPTIQYVVEEAVAAGLDDVAIVVSPGKSSITAHFDPDVALETHLESKGAGALLDTVRATSTLATLTEVVQDEPRGLGHAVACAEGFVAGEPFAVMLADDFLDERDRALDAMIAIHERTGGSVILLLEVGPDRIGSYGSVDPVAVEPGLLDGVDALAPDAEVYRIARLIEKPAAGEEYSNFAVVGRYVFTPAVFDALRATKPGRGGEIQLTDAIAALADTPADDGGGVYGLVFRGRRYDTGDTLDYLKATVQIASARPDLGPEFTSWLRYFVAEGGQT
jgi:UTP--glucose-1-phosphate uridylyltransferase